MDFKTHNEQPIDPSGTHLQGYCAVPYSELKRVLGAPTDGDGGYKVSCEWDVEFADGTVATVYNWKRNLDDPENCRQWNIGGESQRAVWHLSDALRDKGANASVRCA